MEVYWLGSQTAKSNLIPAISKWNIPMVEDQDGFKALLGTSSEKPRHFLMEIPEVNEKKYSELKAVSERFGKKVKFIIFYQTLKAAPTINKLHGSEILLIGPEERNIADVLLKRFFQSADPLFRRWERFQIVTSGSLSLLLDPQAVQKVSVINFSAHGVRIKLGGDAFKKKDFVVMEYLSHDGKKIRMQSRIAWVKTDGQSSEVGVQFISREL